MHKAEVKTENKVNNIKIPLLDTSISTVKSVNFDESIFNSDIKNNTKNNLDAKNKKTYTPSSWRHYIVKKDRSHKFLGVR